MGIIIGAIIGCVILPIGLVTLYAIELHDKNMREKKGLPPRKYHDITDIDFDYTYTINKRK